MIHLLGIRVSGKVELFEFPTEEALESALSAILKIDPNLEYIKTVEPN